MLSFVAGRVDGSADRPQLLPLETLEIELYRGGRRLGTLVTPPRPAAGPVRARRHRARAAAAARLPAGPYSLRIVGAPVGGGAPTAVDVPFRVR